MTTEKRFDCVMQIVKWIRASVKVDREVAVGFGNYAYNYDPNLDNTAWHLKVDEYGSVIFDPCGYYVQYDHTHKADNSGNSYHHRSYEDFAEREEAAVTDLLSAWPRIKARLLAETERINAVEDFHV